MRTAANEVSNEEPAALTFMAGHEEDINRGAVDEAALKTAAASTQRISSSLRRRACDACRARKVRCDRQDPPCNRCVKMGVACHYSGRAKPTNSRMGMSRFLETLNNRLEHAEAQLASTHLMQQNQPQFSVAWRDVGRTGLPTTHSPPHKTPSQEEAQSQWSSVPAPTYPTHDLQESNNLYNQQLAQQTATRWFNQTSVTTSATSAQEASAFLPLDTFTASNSETIMTAHTMLDNQPLEFEPTIFDIPTPTTEPMPTVLATILQKLWV